MGKALTQKDIVDDLKRLGLEQGMAVEVHSSLSSLGYVEGGASTVITALMEVVGEQGAIVMPADLMSPLLPLTDEDKARGIYAKSRSLDENADGKTGMGIIADTFRTWPNTCLGKGIHRVCAWGRDAERYRQDRYKYLLSIDGWALLIGVDIYHCSSMHIAEETVKLPQEIYDHFQQPEAIQQEIDRMYPPVEGWFIQYRDPNASKTEVDETKTEGAWEKVVKEAERRGLIKRGRVGQADCMLFKVKTVVGIFEDFRRTDPFKLFGIEKK
jgi:aminoglycoside 3-N-acetyltransferase